jgi:hypothetical protein
MRAAAKSHLAPPAKRLLSVGLSAPGTGIGEIGNSQVEAQADTLSLPKVTTV